MISCDLAVFKLTQHGFDGKFLGARIEKVPGVTRITVKHSQDRIVALAKAKSHGAKFTATGGGHVTSNDMFKAMEMEAREKEIKLMEDDKKSRKKQERTEERATEALVRVNYKFEDLKATELIDILRWYQIPSSEIGSKEYNYELWKEISDFKAPSYKKWTEADEAKLEDLKKMEISITDTALGRLQELNRRELEASVHLYTHDQLGSLEKKIEDAKDSNLDSNTGTAI